MGTTLTGTTPQDTYDSLIKVTDNGPLSGTAKYLSDGLGNDSVLALSTARVGVGTNSPSAPLEVRGSLGVRIDEAGTSANVLTLRSDFAGAGPAVNVTTASPLLFLTNNTERLRITSTGNVGIGTGTASRLLTLKNNAGATNGISFQSLATTAEIAAIECNQTLDTIDIEMLSNFAGNGVRFLTGTPTLVERARFTANGLTFNGDTAAANALDDYEEGTWTPVLSGAGTAGTYEQGTTFATYTKIGRQVTLNCYVQLAGSITGGGTGYAIITGLPFAKSTNQQTSGSVFFSGVDFTGSFVSIIFQAASSSSNLYFSETVDNGAAIDLPIAGFSANDVFSFSITYFV